MFGAPSVVTSICLWAFYCNAQDSNTVSTTTSDGVGSYILQGLSQDAGTSTSTLPITTHSLDVKVATPYATRNYTNSTTSAYSGSSDGTTSTLSRTPSSLSSIVSTSSASEDSFNGSTTSSTLFSGTSTLPSVRPSISASNSLYNESTVLATLLSSPSTLVSLRPSSSTGGGLYNGSSSMFVSTSTNPYNSTSAVRPPSMTHVAYNSTSDNSTSTVASHGLRPNFSNQTTATLVGNATITSVPGNGTLATSVHRTVYNSTAPWTVPSNGSGAAYASKCNSEWQSWYSESIDANTAVSSYGYTSTYTVTNFSAALTTLCDGNTQIDGPLTAVWSTTKPWPINSVLYPATVTMPPAPSCSIRRSDCAGVGYSGAMTNQVPKGCTATGSACGQCTIKGSDIQLIYFALPTAANTSRDLCAQSPVATQNACPYGTWAVSTTTSLQTYTGVTYLSSSTELFDYGPSTGTATIGVPSSHITTATYTQTATGCQYTSAGLNTQNYNASTIVSGGVTYHADKVYLSFKSVWAVNSCGVTIGTPRAGSLVAMPTSSVYSVCTNQGGSAAFPYNFADLSGPVPRSAWNCQPYCDTIWNQRYAKNGMPSQMLVGDTPEELNDVVSPWPGDFYVNGQAVFATDGGYCGPYAAQSWYKPWVVVPPQVRALDPEWSDCVVAFEGWYDPPTALTQQTSAAGPTTPTVVATSTSEPKSTQQPVPVQTTSQPSSTPPPSVASTAQVTSATLESAASANTPAQYSSKEDSQASSASEAQPTASVAPSTDDSASPAASNTAANSDSATSDLSTSNALLAVLTAALVDTTAAAVPPSSSANGPTSATDPGPSDPASGALSSQTPNVQTTIAVSDASVTILQASTNSAAIIDGSTISQGSQATVNGQSVSVGDSGVQVGTTFISATIASPSADPADDPVSSDHTTAAATAVITAGSNTITAVQSAGTTILADESSTTTLQQTGAATFAGQTVSAASDGSGIVLNEASTAAYSAQSTSPDPSQVVTAAGDTYTAVQAQGTSAAVVANGGTTVTLSQGASTQLAGQEVSVGSPGDVVIGSTTLDAAPSVPAPSVAISAAGQTISAYQDGSSLVVAAPSSTVTVAQGSSATLAGQTIIAVSGGGSVVVGSSTVALSVADPSANGVVATGSAGGLLTVAQEGTSSYVVKDGTSTITLAAGAGTTFNGASVSVPASTEAAIINGQSVALSSISQAPVAVTTGAVLSGSNGQEVTVVQQGSSYIIKDGSSTVSLTAGASASFGGQAVGIASTGGIAVLNGQSATVSIISPTVTASTEAVLSGSEGQQVTVIQQGSSYIIQDGSSTLTVAAGAQTTFNGQAVSIASTGGVIDLNGQSATVSISQPIITAASEAVLSGSDGQQVTVVQQGSSYIVQDGSSTLTVAAGSETTFAGQTLSIASTGGVAVLNGQSATVSAALASSAAASTGAVLTGSSGQQITVVQQGSSYLVADGTRTLYLSAGSATTLDGVTVSLPTSGSVAVVNGNTLQLSGIPSSVAQRVTQAVVTGVSGQQLTVVQQGSAYVIADGSITATLAAGSQTVVDGETISVPTGGSAVIANGHTVALSTAAAGISRLTQAVITDPAGQQFTILQQGSSYLVDAGSTTIALGAGSQTVIGSETISVPTSGGVGFANGHSVALSTAAAQAFTEALVTDPAGQQLTVLQQGSSYVIQAGSRTITLGAGSQTVIGSETISIPTSGGMVVANGQSVALSTVTLARASPGAHQTSESLLQSAKATPSSAVTSTEPSASSTASSAATSQRWPAGLVPVSIVFLMMGLIWL